MFTRPWPAGCLGCFGYFLAFLLVGAVAGFGGLVVPFFVAAFTALTLAACFVVGLLLRVPPVRRLWERGPMLAVLTLTMGIALFLFGLWSIEKLPPLPEGLDPDG